jgi:hypothetical protein
MFNRKSLSMVPNLMLLNGSPNMAPTIPSELLMDDENNKRIDKAAATLLRANRKRFCQQEGDK